MNFFHRQKKKDPSIPTPNNIQATSAYLSALNNGTKIKVAKLVLDEHITSRAIIMKRCVGDAKWRNNKAAMRIAKLLGLSEEFLEEAIKSQVLLEITKYKNITE